MAKDNRSTVIFDRETNKFQGLDDQIMKQLRETYPKVDIDLQLNKMSLWLMSDRGKKRKGSIGFIVNWLNNASPQVMGTTEQLDLIDSDSPLGHLIREYLEEGWKNNQHIYEFNTIRAKI